MKYNLIEIRPDSSTHGGWKVLSGLDPQDREPGNTTPNSGGFYYCPETILVEEGFQQLKNLLIKNHTEEIARLTKSLESLQELELPE